MVMCYNKHRKQIQDTPVTHAISFRLKDEQKKNTFFQPWELGTHRFYFIGYNGLGMESVKFQRAIDVGVSTQV